MKEYWEVLPGLREHLLAPNARPGYSDLRVSAGEIKKSILNYPEYIAFTHEVNQIFEAWKAKNISKMKGIAFGDHPKALITELSEDLLKAFATARLIDPYDIYQHLMTYWTETMQDDVYMIVVDGWIANRDLIPAELVVKRYFPADQVALQDMEAEKENIQQQMTEMDEEHGGEGGYLEEAKNDKGKITKSGITARFRDVNFDPEASEEERQTLNTHLALIEREVDASRRIREAQRALDAKITARYEMLSVNEVITLVVDDKWLAELADNLQGELDRIIQILAGRTKVIAERYETPLPRLISGTDKLADKVEKDLNEMGFVWK